ncbi:ThrRS/AlaRS common domain-containing protein [Russula earlei]|uniref:ThrRS/AlaRS common domain-containing protein n=1 Tax=Russula earlei TaxID=71964 RepID=A0ACC0UPU0_9AGAM|nr:ThrRS/AlaRS common domain-containing protein [Russula earlei]
MMLITISRESQCCWVLCRIISPSLHVPSDTSAAIPVGLLACQRDPLLRSLKTTIVSAALLKPSPPPSLNKASHTKKAKASSVPTFPHPVLQDAVVWNVQVVKRHGGLAVHYVKPAEDVSDVPDVLASGKNVIVELGPAGFQRRLDHMSMHTSQHLLSSVIDSTLKTPTLTWSLTPWPSPAYIDLPRPLTAAEISSVQDHVNRHVFAGRRVHVQPASTGATATATIDIIRAEPQPSSRELGRGLPRDYSGGVHRLVIIDGVDRTPCCGTHLPSLSTLQLFLFPSPTSSSATSFRHLFLAGPRLLDHLASTHALLARTAGVLSCGAPETPDRVALVVDESKRREKRVEDLERELAGVLGRQLAEEMARWRAADGAGPGPRDDGWVRCLSRTDDSQTARAFLHAVTLAFEAHLLPEQTGEARRFTLLLASSPPSQTSSSTTVVMLLGSEEKRVKAASEELKRQFATLKGGGKATRWSGKFVGVWLAEREGKTAQSLLSRSS